MVVLTELEMGQCRLAVPVEAKITPRATGCAQPVCASRCSATSSSSHRMVPHSRRQHEEEPREDLTVRQLWRCGRPTARELCLHESRCTLSEVATSSAPLCCEALQTPTKRQPGSPLPPMRRSGAMAPYEFTGNSASGLSCACNAGRKSQHMTQDETVRDIRGERSDRFIRRCETYSNTEAQVLSVWTVFGRNTTDGHVSGPFPSVPGDAQAESQRSLELSRMRCACRASWVLPKATLLKWVKRRNRTDYERDRRFCVHDFSEHAFAIMQSILWLRGSGAG